MPLWSQIYGRGRTKVQNEGEETAEGQCFVFERKTALGASEGLSSGCWPLPETIFVADRFGKSSLHPSVIEVI